MGQVCVGYTMANARASDVTNSTLAADTRKIRLLLLAFATILVWLAFDLIWTDGFVLTPRNLTSLSVQMTVTCILAIGMTWLLIAREIDLSAGAVMALVIVVIFQLQVVHEVGPLLTLMAAFAVGILLGLINGTIRIVLLVPSFVVTLAGFSWIRGMAFIVSEGQTHAGTNEFFYLISNSYLPPAYSIALILIVGGYFTWKALRNTLAGQRKLPISRMLDWLQLLVVAGTTIGAAAVFYVYRGLPFPVIGGTSLFGGYGSIWGTVAGSLMMASIANCLSLAGVNTFYQMVATGIILIITIAVDSLVMNRGRGV